MIEVVNAAFRFELSPQSEAELERYARSLFAVWEQDIEVGLPFADYSLFLSIEEGSLTGKSKILVAATVFGSSVIALGGLVAGVREIKNGAEWVADRFVERAKEHPLTHNKPLKYSRHDSASLRKLAQLFDRVADQELTPAEATAEAAMLFSSEAGPDDMPESLRREMLEAFESIRLNPQQLHLPLDYTEPPLPAREPRERKPRTPGPAPSAPLPEPHGFVIEIRRDRKNAPPIITRRRF